MKTTRIARILDLVGEFMPGVHELTLLLPALFGLHYAARAIGFDLDLGPEAVAVISVTFGCFVWIIFSSLAYSKPEGPDETTSKVLRERDSSSASPRAQASEIVQVTGCTAKNRLKQEADSIHLKSCHGESSAQEKRTVPAGFP